MNNVCVIRAHQFCRQTPPGNGNHNINNYVARKDVYDTYLSHSIGFNVPTLNDATFGKCMQVVFPGLDSRRRGERKGSYYTYENLVLMSLIERPEKMSVPK